MQRDLPNEVVPFKSSHTNGWFIQLLHVVDKNHAQFEHLKHNQADYSIYGWTVLHDPSWLSSH